ncbi:MAG TPA: MBL fold metallo-hydrolase [Terriglobales bacterium]|nr:MBL fold metallo-hydrolase [Terriglobales bacterium]
MNLPKALVCVVLSVAMPLSLNAQPTSKQDFQTVPVAEGIYAFIASESDSGVVQGNVILIVGDESALVVDSGQLPPLTRRMVAEIRKLTSKPVRLLVNTHWHGDHLLTDHIFRDAFPGLSLVAHSETRRLGEKNYATWPERVKEFPKMVATLRERLNSGKKKDGTPLTDEEKLGYEADASALEAVLPDLGDTRYTPADITFTQEITFYLGKREVKVMNLGRGNTPGDAVLWVPDAKVLITGDTVVFPTPYSFGSFHSEWIEVLNKMVGMNAAHIIPGHGPVMHDAAYLKTLVALLEDTRQQVRTAVNDGLSLEDTRKRVTLAKWKDQLAGDDRYRRRAFTDFYLQPGIERAYKEAKGEPLAE